MSEFKLLKHSKVAYIKLLEYVIGTNESGAFIAYIKLSENSPFRNKHYNEIPLGVHGDLTFSGNNATVLKGIAIREDWWIGWDYGHFGDYIHGDSKSSSKVWTLEEVEAEVHKAILDLVNLEKSYVGI